jgi:hypothetical protein
MKMRYWLLLGVLRLSCLELGRNHHPAWSFDKQWYIERRKKKGRLSPPFCLPDKGIMPNRY